MKDLKRFKAIMVTGSSTGIGRACALYLDNLGFQVFAGVRTKKDAENLKKCASNKLIPVLMDITDEISIRSAVKFITHSIGKSNLMGLVNNAGIAIGGPLEFLPIKEIQKQFEVNVIGHIMVTQTFLPLLRENQGRIVNIGSISGRISGPFIGPYAASKFALEAISDTFRMELKPWGVTVSIIEPGRIATPIWEKSLTALNKIMKHFPSYAQELYGATLDKANEKRKRIGKIGISPLVVAKAVAHALTAKRPRTRYIVGKDAKILAFIARFFPEQLRDWFIMKQLR